MLLIVVALMFAAEMGTQTAAPTKNAPSAAPERVAGHSSGPPTIESQAADAELVAADPTAPATDKSRLN
jgi:hypothetical protein